MNSPSHLRPHWIPGRKSWMRLRGLSRRSTANVPASRRTFTRSGSTRRRSSWRKSTILTSSVRLRCCTCTTPHYSTRCFHVTVGQHLEAQSWWNFPCDYFFSPTEAFRTDFSFLQNSLHSGFRAFTTAKDGSKCLAMEYGGEQSLNDLIEKRKADGLPAFPAANIEKVALHVARGLQVRRSFDVLCVHDECVKSSLRSECSDQKWGIESVKSNKLTCSRCCSR